MTQIPQSGESVTLPTELPPIPHASTNEKLIVGKLVTDLLAAGASIDVFDGEETVLQDSRDPAAIYAALSSTDMDTLYVHNAAGARSRSFVLLVWGNDVDVISDYGVSLEPYVGPANALSEALEVRP